MCKAVELVLEPPCYKKSQYPTKMSKNAPVPTARRNAADHTRISYSDALACVGVALPGVDMLRPLVATLLIVVFSLVGLSSSGWIGFITEMCPLIAEDLDSLALLLLLCLLASQMQCRIQTSPSRSTRTKVSDPDAHFGLDGDSPRQRPGSSSRKAHRRRTLQHALYQLGAVVNSLNTGTTRDATPQMSPCYNAKLSAASCGLHNFHKTCSRHVLLPVEVAACQYPSDVSGHLQRLLEDRWTVAVTGGVSVSLASIAE